MIKIKVTIKLIKKGKKLWAKYRTYGLCSSYIVKIEITLREKWSYQLCARVGVKK